MHVHILGICGTLMGGIAQLAKSLGYRVTGSDANYYPPMSTQLSAAGIMLYEEGYDPSHLEPAPDLVIVGNTKAISRGNPILEYLLNSSIPYISGPQWLSENLLHKYWVLAVSGTHGKTTTSAMLAWILEYAGLEPGFLIGGIPQNFGISARLGKGRFFVVEADEYRTAFFDERPKFMHYRPKTLTINNLEMDHADIFENLGKIQQQFANLLRTVPTSGLVLYPKRDLAIDRVLDLGCWTAKETTSVDSDTATWRAFDIAANGCSFTVLNHQDEVLGKVHWPLLGQHNISNALIAIGAANHVGVNPSISVEALNKFSGVKRRMELRGEPAKIKIYDDFAHHPTAVRATLDGLRAFSRESKILAVLEPSSNTMRMGFHAEHLAEAMSSADHVFLYIPANLSWNTNVMASLGIKLNVINSIDKLVEAVTATAIPGDSVVVMSSGGFEGVHQLLINALTVRAAHCNLPFANQYMT